MKVEAYKCDVCGKQKGEVNHWFVSFFQDGFMSLYRWNGNLFSAFEAVHLCGAECVQKKVNEFLSKVSP